MPTPETEPPPPVDLAQFERLATEATPKLFRLAARLMGSRADAEDVVQEALFRAFSAHRQGQFDGRSEATTWLYSIVTHVALNALRERKRRSSRDEAWQPTSSNAHSAMEAHAGLNELSKWMDALPEDQRAALVLKELEGLSTSEVAQVMGCSVGAVEQRVHRARAALREKAER